MSIYVIEIDEGEEQVAKTIGFASTQEKAEKMLEMYKNASDVPITRELIYKAPVDIIEIDDDEVAV
jgi:hypothetical protein